MLVDMMHALNAYLVDVFVTRLDWWVALGMAAQLLFTARFLVQWIASERAGRSVIPMAFWVFSIFGGLLLLVYALYRKDAVFIAGQAFGVFVYRRNLYFVMRERKAAIAASVIMISAAAASAAKPRSRSAIRSSTASSPICKRTVGPPGSHLVAERNGRAVERDGEALVAAPRGADAEQFERVEEREIRLPRHRLEHHAE